jgi:hypothetical protein
VTPVDTVEQELRYLRPSALRGSDLLLATSGGTTRAGPQDHPRLFTGALGQPEQAAVALLVVARVARTRFYAPPGMIAAAIRAADPVVTSNGDRLRFESFSACCGVYARLDLLPGSLDRPALDTGTTNVDLNPPTRQALAGVAAHEPLHLDVGLDDVVVTTLDGSAVERRVPLPDRWLKGFAEVQTAAAAMVPRLELDAAQARRFLQALPRQSSRAAAWAVPAGSGARLASRPADGAVCAGGPERLRVLEPLLRFTRGLRAYGAPTAAAVAPSAWELALDDARLVVVLSPEPSRGFSGEGGVLLGLAEDGAGDDADLVASALDDQLRLEPAALAAATGLGLARVLTALPHLSAAGRVGFDLAESRWFRRELPYDRRLLERMHPRLVAARALAESGAVRYVADGAEVRSGDVTHRVRWDESGDRCTCPWWGRHLGGRGPCKHVLAARLLP